MQKNDLLELAETEFVNVISNCTETELDRFVNSLWKLSGSSPWNCVYGLLTGSCWSERATELIQVCTRGMFFLDLGALHPETSLMTKCKLNRSTDDSNLTYTPLEKALLFYREEVEEIIKKYI